MEFGKKLLIGALSLVIAAGVGEYKLYKKFEHTPNPIGEVVRWPYNDTWTECDRLAGEYKRLTENIFQSVRGKVQNIEGLEGCTYMVSSNGRSYFRIKRDTLNFIELEGGKRFAYAGDFFAGKGDEISLRVLHTKELLQREAFLEQVKRFRAERSDWLWTTRGYDEIFAKMPNIRKSVENIPLTKLNHLDGLIETYDILQDK